jgi:hypothetical protein
VCAICVEQQGRNAFFLACWRNHDKIARTLQRRMANPHVVDVNGHTAHDVAVEWGAARAIALCVELGVARGPGKAVAVASAPDAVAVSIDGPAKA